MFKKIFLFTLFSLLTSAGCLAASSDKIVVYYFYQKPRCITCKNIETYTQEAVKELNSSNIQYKTVDLDEKTNKSYKEKYKLYTKSVVITKVKNGKELKYKNLGQIFIKVRNKEEFKKYIKDEIEGI